MENIFGVIKTKSTEENKQVLIWLQKHTPCKWIKPGTMWSSQDQYILPTEILKTVKIEGPVYFVVYTNATLSWTNLTPDLSSTSLENRLKKYQDNAVSFYMAKAMPWHELYYADNLFSIADSYIKTLSIDTKYNTRCSKCGSPAYESPFSWNCSNGCPRY